MRWLIVFRGSSRSHAVLSDEPHAPALCGRQPARAGWLKTRLKTMRCRDCEIEAKRREKEVKP